jgi:hypothetical protein
VSVNVWRPLDWLGYRAATWWTPQLQVRTGTLCTLAGIALVPFVLVSGEPPLIYLMSAGALVLSGMSILVTAVLALHEDPEASEEDLDPDG